MTTLQLNESASVTLDGSGNGTVRMRPDGSREHWQPALASVKCSSAVKEATCKIYAGQNTADQYFVDGTFTGSSGDSTDRVAGTDISRSTSAYIFAVWTGGDAGAQATLNLTGSKTL